VNEHGAEIDGQVGQVTVYWRPGCGFCSRLLGRLDDAGMSYAAINIWDHPDAAAVVRSYARGNETVPTVVVNTSNGPVGLVNPDVGAIAELVAG
jgi:mycoredoxin